MNLRRPRSVLSEINVTPLVDVMLVLLVIFMITAPLLRQGIDVNLPEAKGRELPNEERVNLSIKKDGAIFLNNNPVTMDEMLLKMKAISRLNPTVYLKADRDVPYGMVVTIMSEVREAGVERLGIVTEPRVTLK